ncbi:hypothetical protein NPX13_g3864 [Xylaria arbuscula]|uniref:Uncharacterized protein n=1 Tax=Xylaria arbuscula TaxID=114810 RepID=A0A9W8NGY6_9PEZI|nr:hypothetical protein NPX13_g3864 [Xylaria arbuscula]
MASASSALLPRLSSAAFGYTFRLAMLSSQQSRQSPFPSIPALAIATSRRHFQHPILTRRHMGRHPEGRAQEEDVAHEEEA